MGQKFELFCTDVCATVLQALSKDDCSAVVQSGAPAMCFCVFKKLWLQQGLSFMTTCHLSGGLCCLSVNVVVILRYAFIFMSSFFSLRSFIRQQQQ